MRNLLKLNWRSKTNGSSARLLIRSPMSDSRQLAADNASSRTIRNRITRLSVCCLIAAMYTAYQFRAMSPQTTYEHHPYAGPLIFIHTANGPVDAFFGIVFSILLGAAVFAFPVRLSLGTLIVSFLGIIMWFLVSMIPAWIAST
jgi:hypothetical protein